jgi:hypothetical protein
VDDLRGWEAVTGVGEVNNTGGEHDCVEARRRLKREVASSMGGDDTIGKGCGGAVGFELKDTSTGGIPGRREGVATQRISQLLCIERMIFC